MQLYCKTDIFYSVLFEFQMIAAYKQVRMNQFSFILEYTAKHVWK